MTFLDFTERLARYLHVKPKALYKVIDHLKSGQVKAICSDIIEEFRDHRIARNGGTPLVWWLCHKKIDKLNLEEFMRVTLLVRDYVNKEYGIKVNYDLHGLESSEWRHSSVTSRSHSHNPQHIIRVQRLSRILSNTTATNAPMEAIKPATDTGSTIFL